MGMNWFQAAGNTAAVVGATYGVVEGERQSKVGKQARQQQAKAQMAAEDAAMRQERQAAEATRKANQRKPDVSALLAGQQGFGISSMLSGSAGVALNRLRLGRASALGG